MLRWVNDRAKAAEQDVALRAVVGDEAMPEVRAAITAVQTQPEPQLKDPADVALTLSKAGMAAGHLPDAFEAVRLISRDHGYSNNRAAEYVAAVHAITGARPIAAVSLLGQTMVLLDRGYE